jgi:hypothetical protein
VPRGAAAFTGIGDCAQDQRDAAGVGCLCPSYGVQPRLADDTQNLLVGLDHVAVSKFPGQSRCLQPTSQVSRDGRVVQQQAYGFPHAGSARLTQLQVGPNADDLLCGILPEALLQ